MSKTSVGRRTCDRCGESEDHDHAAFAHWGTFRGLDACPACTAYMDACWAEEPTAKPLPPLATPRPVTLEQPSSRGMTLRESFDLNTRGLADFIATKADAPAVPVVKTPSKPMSVAEIQRQTFVALGVLPPK
jgi:hypothetical protein